MYPEQELHPSRFHFMLAFIKRYRALSGKLSMAVLDQAIFAGSNFLFNIVLARWMFPDQYGAYVVAYSWFLIAQNMYEAFVVEPLAVFGSGKYAQRLPRYFGIAFTSQLGFAVLLMLPLTVGALAAFLSGSPLVAMAIFGAAVSSPMMVTRWLFRQPFYVMGKLGYSVFGSLIYLGVVLVCVTLFHSIDAGPISQLNMLAINDPNRESVFWIMNGTMLNPFTAMLSMGMGAVVGAIFLIFVFIKPNFKRGGEVTYRQVLEDHWRYGRWSSLDRLVAWIPANIFYVMMPLIGGLAGSATLRALSNLTLPLYMTISAMTSVLLPSFVHIYTQQGRKGLNNKVRDMMIMVLLLLIPVVLTLAFFGQWIVSFLYSGRYDTMVTFAIMFTMALHPLLSGVVQILDVGLRAQNKVKYNLISRVVPVTITLTLGLWLLSQYGIIGANIASLTTSSVHALMLLYQYRRIGRMGEVTEKVVPAEDTSLLQPSAVE